MGVEAFWWAFVTMTTVGFGDIYPRTLLGKVVSIFSMGSGILIIALPVAIVGRKFQEVYDKVSSEEGRSLRFGDGITALLKAKKASFELFPVKKTAMTGMSHRIRTLRLAEEVDVSDDIRDLAALYDEADEMKSAMHKLEVAELFRQDELARKLELLLDSVMDPLHLDELDEQKTAMGPFGVVKVGSTGATAPQGAGG